MARVVRWCKWWSPDAGMVQVLVLVQLVVQMVRRRLAERRHPPLPAGQEVGHQVLQQGGVQGVPGGGPGDRRCLLSRVQQEVAEVVQVQLEWTEHQRAAPGRTAPAAAPAPAQRRRAEQRPLAGSERRDAARSTATAAGTRLNGETVRRC